MNWNDLQLVLSAARHRTLIKTGQDLGVAHTTVGRRLKVLESAMGTRLFDRGRNGLIPTAEGVELIEVATHVEREVLRTERRISGRDGRLEGRLCISTVDVIFQCFGEAFTSFTDQHPDVVVAIKITREVVSLAQREADVVLRVSNGPLDTLFGRKIGTMQFGVYAATALVERIGPDAPLGAYPWIGWDGGQHSRWFDSWLAENAPGARISLRMTDRGLMMAEAVRLGAGAQILPCILADPDAKLSRIAPLDDAFRMGIWALTLADLRENKRIRAFMAHMAEKMGTRSAALAGRG